MQLLTIFLALSIKSAAMKKSLLFTTVFLSLAIAYGQNCHANFGFTIGANNVVTVHDSSTIPATSCTKYVEYNYGDPQPGELNSSNWIFHPTSGYQHFYKNAGTYTICQSIFTDNFCTNPCSDTICKQITLPNNGSNCQAVYTYNPTGLLYSFSDSSSADDSITSIFWDFGDGTPLSPIHNPNHIYPFQANYVVCLYIQTSNGCESETCDTLTSNQTGLNEYLNNKSFTIFPNPASNYITIAMPANVSKAEIKILNLLGELEYSSIATKQSTNIDVSGLASGLHIIQITTGNNISRQKFIKK